LFLQPSFIVAILALGEDNEDRSSIVGAKLQRNETSVVPLVSKGSSLVDALINYIERADDLIKRYNLEGFCRRGLFVCFLL
jgi:nuclear pore complex protein Nup188